MKVGSFEQPFASQTKKSLGIPNRLGEHILGWSRLGFRNIFAGIYQVRHKPVRKGQFVVRERFYRPANPQTPAQQDWRDNFRAGMIAWSILTEGQKYEYNQRAEKIGLYGVNIFLREWLTS